MTTIISGDTGISPVTASGTSASVDGMTVGRGGGEVSTNTAVGASALNGTNTGGYTTALGYQAGYSNTSGQNTLIGANSGQYITTGTRNTGVGVSTLGFNNGASSITVSDNTAIGHAALTVLTSGASNTAIGSFALQSNTTASNNTAVGYQAGYSNSTSSSNTFMGYQAGYNSTGTFNTIIGVTAGKELTTGNKNIFIGGSNGVTGGAGQAITTGSSNLILGCYTGNNGGLDIRTASNYIVLSDGDGNPRQVISSSGDVFIGTTATFSYANGKVCVNADSSGNPAIVAGVNGTSTAYNNIVLGNSTGSVGRIQTNGSATSYLTSSDHRLKTDVAPIQNALATVQRLNPVAFTWTVDNRADAGFLAHEFQEVLPNYADGIKDEVNSDGKPIYQAVDKSGAIPYLVKAVQELKTIVDAQAAEIAELKAKVGI